MSNEMKVGLVLSGGGAKGAYQVGVLKALRELGTQVDAVSGASIGALNGAVLASAPSLNIGVQRLENLWMSLATSSPLVPKILEGKGHGSPPLNTFLPGYLTLLASAGLAFRGQAAITAVLEIAKVQTQRAGVKWPEGLDAALSGFLSDSPLKKLMDEYLDIDALNKGLPLYISVYKSLGGISDIARVFAAEFGVVDTAPSEFLHIQSLPVSEQKQMLLASAAIPLLFAPKQGAGSLYSDGGQGGWQKQQGNTPITPLLEAGYNMIMVTHLNDGSLWSRHDFPEATILEIRPQRNITRDPSLFDHKDLLGFATDKIPSWIEQGYEDTMHCVGRVMKASAARYELRSSERTIEESEAKNATADRALDEAMSRLV